MKNTIWRVPLNLTRHHPELANKSRGRQIGTDRDIQQNALFYTRISNLVVFARNSYYLPN